MTDTLTALDAQRASIIAHLEAEASRRPRARAFTRGIRYAIDEIRNRFDEADEPAPEGVRATYHGDQL